MVKRWVPGFALLALAASQPAAAQSPSYALSPQDVLIGANLVQAMTNNGAPINGAGITFAVIDTGVAAPWVGFTNSIVGLPASNCVITPRCNQSLALTDDNGHGTFVASEIVGSVPAVGFVGVAPGGSVISIKALNAAGAGTAANVAQGIINAADEGARILNLSLGPLSQSAPLISAINYAASKGALIVFAGGNTGTAFNANAKISGLTDQAIQSLIFMGSTNSAQQLSSFSTTPGAGGFVSTSGTFYSFQSRWMVADGENIWGASNYHDQQNGYDYITQASGTSMTVPQASGSAGLLLQRWPFLTGPQVAAILLGSAQHLGDGGVNASYGEGFLNVYDAFITPVGALDVSVNGVLVPAASGAITSSNALGNMSAVAGALGRLVAFDAYHRDFPTAGGALITSKAASGISSAGAQVMGQSGANSLNFTDLGNGGWVAFSFAGTPTAPVWVGQQGHANPGLMQDPSRRAQNDWSIGLAQSGSFIGVGQGSNAGLSFDEARWGGKTAFFNSDASVAGTLLGLASGTSFAAAGLDVSPTSRFSFAVVTASDDSLANLTGATAAARGFALGYSFTATRWLQISLTSSYLGERDMLLGSPSGGYLALGPSANTASLGFGFNLDLGDGFQFGGDSNFASTDPTHNSASLITGTSRLTSAAFGVALRKDDLLAARDTLGLSIKMPFRVYAGSAGLSLPVGNDALGNAVVEQMNASLVPTGHETDFALDYARPLGNGMSAGASFTYRRDADNVAGATDGAFLVRFKAGF